MSKTVYLIEEIPKSQYTDRDVAKVRVFFFLLLLYNEIDNLEMMQLSVYVLEDVFF